MTAPLIFNGKDAKLLTGRDLLGSDGSVYGKGNEKSYTAAAARAGYWGTSGAGITIADDSTSAELPRPTTTATGLKITGVSGSTAYAYYRFVLDDADANTKLKVQFALKPVSGYVSNDFKVDVYSNTASDYTTGNTRLVLSTDSSAVTGIPNLTGTFRTTFDAPAVTAKWIEVRIGLNGTNTHACVFSDLIVGPGTSVQGPAVTDWGSSTVTGTWNTNVAYTAETRRVGADAQIRMRVSCSGAPNSTALAFNMPTGMSIDTARMLDSTAGVVEFGKGVVNKSGSTKYPVSVRFNTTTQVKVYVEDSTGANNQIGNNVDQATPVTFASGDSVEIYFQVPVAEWAGSGTVNVAQNDVEYAYNTGSTTTAGDSTSNLTQFGYGPVGTPFLAVASTTTTGNSSTYYRCRFQTPIQATDQIILETQETSTSPWVPALYPLIDINGSRYGMAARAVSGSATDVDVGFGNAGVSPFGATSYGSAGAAWSGNSSYRWRVRKVKGGQAVGFGFVQPGVSSGLVSASGLPGNTTGSAIASGYVGERIAGTINANSITTGVTQNVASVPLTAGVWRIEGWLAATSTGNTPTNPTNYNNGWVEQSISATSGSLDNMNRSKQVIVTSSVNNSDIYLAPNVRYVNTSSAVTYYLVIQANFGNTPTMTESSANTNFYAVRIA